MRSWHFDSQAIESGDTPTYDRAYGSAEEREERKMLVGNGIYANPATNMQVVADNGMTVKVKPGACWIEGAFGVVDNDESKTLTASENGRIDLIVARFDLSLSARDIHIDVIQGTEGSTSPPGITRSNSVYDIQLAKINVRAGAASILQSDITDTRYDSAVCGIVAGILDQIDTTNLFAQYQDTFDDFMADLETALSGDVAGNLLALINNHIADTDNPHNVTKSQVGLENVDNVKQYSENNPPPGPYKNTTQLATSEITVTLPFEPTAIIISTTKPAFGTDIDNKKGASILYQNGSVEIYYNPEKTDISLTAELNDASLTFSKTGTNLMPVFEYICLR